MTKTPDRHRSSYVPLSSQSLTSTPDSTPPSSRTILVEENPGSTMLSAGKCGCGSQSKSISGEPPAKKVTRPIQGTGDERLGNIQVATNALEISTASAGARTHSIQLVFNDENLHFWYFDAAGMIKSEDTLHFRQNFSTVAAALIGLASCDAFRLGALPIHVAELPSEQAYPSYFPPKNLTGFTITIPVNSSKTSFTIGQLLHVQYALIGRRTAVYECNAPCETAKTGAVVKILYQATNRANEWELIDHARKQGVKHLPHVYAYHISTISGIPSTVHARGSTILFLNLTSLRGSKTE